MMDSVQDIINQAKCLDKEEKVLILKYLNEHSSVTINELTSDLNIPAGTVYKYLQAMKQAGFLHVDQLPGKKGKHAYSLSQIGSALAKDMLEGAKKRKRLIIFDLDDTLIRRDDIPIQLAELGTTTINEAIMKLKPLGIHVSLPPRQLFTKKWINSKYGNSIQWYFSTWLRVAGVPEEKLSMFVDKYVDAYYKRIEKTALNCRLYSDVLPFLRENRDSFNFAVMSNSSHKTIKGVLKENKVLEYFQKDGVDLIVGGDEVPKSRDTILAIVQKAKVSREQIVIVGDTGGDIRAGRDFGVPANKTIIINRGVAPMDFVKVIKPRVPIISNLEELNNMQSVF